jgi:hypothetical protein
MVGRLLDLDWAPLLAAEDWRERAHPAVYPA